MIETLISDAGPHPPEVWADLSARHIAGQHDNGNLAAHALQTAIKMALVPVHQAVQIAERQALVDSPRHVAEMVDLDDALNRALAIVLNVAMPTPWHDHFLRREVQDAIRQVLGRHFATEIQIERLHHAERHPDCEYVRLFQNGKIA